MNLLRLQSNHINRNMFVRSQQPAFIVSSSLPLANSLNYSSRFQKCPTTSIKRTASAYMCCQSSPNRSAHLPDANQFISISPSSCDLAYVEESANFDQELDTSGPTSGNINNNNNSNNNNNNNNNNNDNNNDDDKERANILSKYGKTESDLQQNIRAIKTDELNAYLKATASGLSSIFAKFWPGWRVRVAADPEFPFKLLMEQTVGLGLTVSGMIAARGKNILNELDFAICDTVVGATMNFVLVYLLTPALGAASSGGMFATLPANLFVYGNYSLLARLGGFFYKSALFSACGFAASMIGTGISQGLVKLKRSNNKNNNLVTNIHQPELPNIFVNSAAWAGFMFVSSSPRYQTVAGLERLMFSCAPESVAKLGSALVRTGNNVLGGATWVIWAKAIGLQKSDDDNKKSE